MKHSRRIFRRMVRLMSIYLRWPGTSNCRGSKAF